MPEQPRFAAVQAHYLLAALAFVVRDDPHYGGIKIQDHPSSGGALISSTTGKQIAVIHDGHGVVRGPATFWVIPAKELAKELKKIEDSSAKYFGDIWALVSWTGSFTGSVQLIEADTGAQALDGSGRMIKTILRDSDNLVLLGQVPSTLENILGAAAVSRELAPNYWFMPYGMERLAQFAQAIRGTFEGGPTGISFLRTKAENRVQVAFRDHEEAAVFLATIRTHGAMHQDNPAWLEALL